MRETGSGVWTGWLFGTAASFNVGMGVAILFLRAPLGPLFGLDPVEGANLVFANLTGGMILLFAVTYLLVAWRPERYRDFIWLGIVGKLVAVLGVILPFLAGAVSFRMVPPVLVDAVYILLFSLYLRRTHAPTRPS
jgi:hypothetical protein